MLPSESRSSLHVNGNYFFPPRKVISLRITNSIQFSQSVIPSQSPDRHFWPRERMERGTEIKAKSIQRDARDVERKIGRLLLDFFSARHRKNVEVWWRAKRKGREGPATSMAFTSLAATRTPPSCPRSKGTTTTEENSSELSRRRLFWQAVHAPAEKHDKTGRNTAIEFRTITV